MANQQQLFYEDVNEALRSLVHELGGPKKVGPLLWPDLTLDGAAGRIRDCLNADRRERLSPEQLILLMKKGREVGSHIVMHFLADECGYKPPEPMNPDDEKTELQRMWIQSVQMQRDIATRMEKLTAGK